MQKKPTAQSRVTTHGSPACDASGSSDGSAHACSGPVSVAVSVWLAVSVSVSASPESGPASFAAGFRSGPALQPDQARSTKMEAPPLTAAKYGTPVRVRRASRISRSTLGYLLVSLTATPKFLRDRDRRAP